MSLLHDIQAASISQSTDVPTLLRMCKLLAARIGNAKFAEWVDRELNGYPNAHSLPDYRVVHVDSYGSFIGPYSRADRLQIILSLLPEELREKYSYAHMAHSISAYTPLIEGDKSGCATEAWPVGLAVKYASKMTPDMQCVSAWKEIPIGAVVRLLDSVKTRVLGFAIDLEREAPDVGDTPIGREPQVSQEKITQIFNTNISGSVGNISNASSAFSQEAHVSIQPGDWQALNTYLGRFGLHANDLDGLKATLEEALSNRSKASEMLQNSKTSWIGRLAAKAASGAAGVSLKVATAGIAQAIAAYLGLPGAKL